MSKPRQPKSRSSKSRRVERRTSTAKGGPSATSTLLPEVASLPRISGVAKDPDPVFVAKLFITGMTWYVAAAEKDAMGVSRFADDYILWVYADSIHGSEWGQQSLRELEQVRIFGAVRVERDRGFMPTRYSELV